MSGFKIKYRNGIYGTPVEWTPENGVYVNAMSSIKRRLESKIKGEAGLIGFDNVGLTLRNEGPVAAAFNGDLSSVQRYIFEIYGIKSTGAEVKCFEGIADFSSIKRPDLERKIKFNVVDKLKALDILTNNAKQRTALFDWRSRINDSATHYIFKGEGSADPGGPYNRFAKVFFEFTVAFITTAPVEDETVYSNNGSNFLVKKNKISGSSGTIICEWISGNDEPEENGILTKVSGTGDNNINYSVRIKICDAFLILSKVGDNQVQHTQVALKKGETLLLYAPNTSNIFPPFLVIDSWLSATPSQVAAGGIQTTWVRLYPHSDVTWTFPNSIVPGDTYQPIGYAYPSTYYSYAENYIDINHSSPDIYGRYSLQSFDALKILEVIVKNAWPDVTIINRVGSAKFPISLDNFSLLLDEMVLGKHTYDAVKMLADSMRCYVFFDKLGRLVLQRKTNIGADGTLRTFNVTKKTKGEKSDYWDKIADGVEVKVKSGRTINGITLEGFASVQKHPGIKPRNPVKMEIIAPDNIEPTQTALDSYAYQIAVEVMNFYGKRHGAYPISTALFDDMLDWELIDRIQLGGVNYFFENLDLDLFNWKGSIGNVEIQGHDYDRQQVHLALNKENYAAASRGGSGSTQTNVTQTIGGTVELNFTVDPPLEITEEVVLKLNITENLKLSLDDKLDTVQDIKKTSTTIEFARLGLGGAPDATAKLKVTGDVLITGNEKIDGYSAIGGAVDTNFRQRIYGNQKVTGNITVDGDIYIGGVINQVNVVDLDVADHAIRLNKGGDNTTALDGGIEMLGAGDALLASIKYEGANWISDINFNLASGKVYKINNTEVLSATTLGSAVINSSLTKVGTLTTGIWNATVINGQYVNHNTTNLKVTSNSLNTIQDIATTSTPQFLQLTLTNAGTTTSHAVRADRSITTSDPLRIATLTSANLTADRNLTLLFNSTNLKITTNALNTIQDIATTSSPTFVNATLSGRLDQQGTTNSEFGSQSILPKQNYYGNLGAINKKWLTLHAAELWVETLVAQETIATIGGRVLVGPTTVLVSDLSSGSSTINVKHNQMVSGDVVYMEAEGKVEFMRINSSYSGSAGNYTYSVVRNLDGTGANNWFAGDAMFNTGQSGNGFIDLYSIRGIKTASQAGPTIVGNVRNSTTYNDWSEHWAIGNLNYLYGYTSNTYGVGLGKYANSSSFITIDSTNGIRLRYRNAGGSVSDKITLSMAGAVYIDNYLQVGSAAADVNAGVTTISGGKITTNTITVSHLNFTPLTSSGATGEIVATINASGEGIGIAASKINITGTTTFYNGNTLAQAINAGSTTISGGKITTNTITLSHLNFTPLTSSGATGAIVATINASAEGIAIASTKINITGTTTFYNGNTLAQAINAGTTTISGDRIRTGVISSNNWGSSAGSSIDLTNGNLYFGGSSEPKFFVEDDGFMSATYASIANWSIDANKIMKTVGTAPNTRYIAMAALSSSMAGSGGNYPTIMLADNPGTMAITIGHVYYKAQFQNEYGIVITDNAFSGAAMLPMFRITKGLFSPYTITAQIAGIDFDYQRIYSISSNVGFEISKASSKNVTTGFAVWNITTSPKFFIGDSTSSMDWNNTSTGKLTVKGDVVSSRFTTHTAFVTMAGSFTQLVQAEGGTFYCAKIDDVTGNRQWTKIEHYNITLTDSYSNGQIATQSLYYSSGFQITNQTDASKTILAASATGKITIGTFNLSKFYGVTDAAPTSNVQPGDYYMGSNGTLAIRSNSGWNFYSRDGYA